MSKQLTLNREQVQGLEWQADGTEVSTLLCGSFNSLSVGVSIIN
jgi:hypothetical protein